MWDGRYFQHWESFNALFSVKGKRFNDRSEHHMNSLSFITNAFIVLCVFFMFNAFDSLNVICKTIMNKYCLN